MVDGSKIVDHTTLYLLIKRLWSRTQQYLSWEHQLCMGRNFHDIITPPPPYPTCIPFLFFLSNTYKYNQLGQMLQLKPKIKDYVTMGWCNNSWSCEW